MKIKLLLTALFVSISGWIMAQDNVLMVQGTAPKLHLVHTVAAKETWYSIGRLYNISPKELAPYNGLKMDAPLAIGQTIKVPLAVVNFSQDGRKAADESLVPVYHTVQEKEWMYRISQNHNKVPVEKLEQWNKVSNDDLRPGMKVIIGYLKVKTSQSSLASGKNIPVQPPVATTTTKTQDKPVTTIPKDEEKQEVVDKPQTVKTDTKTTSTPNNTVPDDPRPVVNKSIDYNGGYFRSQYASAGKATVGTAGVFKSTSGWRDGKYYALMNNVPVGTIVRIEHPLTRKQVYAKVLGQLPDMKESNGLAIRLSDAAAAELGAGAYKFSVGVSY